MFAHNDYYRRYQMSVLYGSGLCLEVAHYSEYPFRVWDEVARTITRTRVGATASELANQWNRPAHLRLRPEAPKPSNLIAGLVAKL